MAMDCRRVIPPLVRPVARIVACAMITLVVWHGAWAAEADGESAKRPAADQLEPNDQPAEPAVPAPFQFTRGPGGGLGFGRAAVWWLLVLGWAVTTGWAGRDAERTPGFDRLWLPLVTVPFLVTALLAWWIPWSYVALPLTAAAWLGPWIAWARRRDATATRDEKLLSRATVVKAVAPILERVGIQVGASADMLLPSVSLAAVSGDGVTDEKAALEQAARLPGFVELRGFIQRAAAARARRAVLEIDRQGGRQRIWVDGVWFPMREAPAKRSTKGVEAWQESPPIEPGIAAEILAATRTLCGLPEKAAAGRQAGRFVATVDGKKVPCSLDVKVEAEGTRMTIDLSPPEPAFTGLASLGMPAPVVERVKEALGLSNGIVVVSAPSGEGLSTMFLVVLQTMDRLIRDCVILEDAAAPLKEVQNVVPVRWGGDENLAPKAALEKAMRVYPTAMVVPDLKDGPLAEELGRLAGEVFIVVGVRARGAVHAIEQLVKLGIPPATLARTLLVSVSQRLVRRLCPRCSLEYEPTKELLARLGRQPGSVKAFRKEPETGCMLCFGTGHTGRTGLVEVAGGELTSKALAAAADRATLQKAAVRDGMRQLRDAGVDLAAEGVVSLEEVHRVLVGEAGK